MGFRGEALSSICNIANLTLQTKQKNQNTGWQVKFNHMGDVVSKEQMAKKVAIKYVIINYLGRLINHSEGSVQRLASQIDGVQEKL
jgi:DNA mismatch repair ATPase MutL